jgi:steroid 5-alpha reductase family enzyme
MHLKTTSLLIIGIHYVIAIGLAGIIFFNVNTNNVIVDILIANITATLYIYLAGIILKNASLYDPYWSVMPPVILIFFSFVWGNAFQFHIIIMNAAVLIWSIRLTFNWARNWKDFSHQDWRYTMIKQKFPKLYPLSSLLGIHLFPTLIVYVQLIGALYYIMLAQRLSLIAWIAAIMIVAAVYVQYVADEQMHAYKKGHPKGLMNKGLWAYSRHPNYFGEIMVWIGVYLFYFSAVGQIDVLMLAPALMFALFIYISIPMMEKRQLASKQDYRSYQKKVSMLLPLPKKRKI